MPNGTIPDFEWRGFLDATLAYLAAHPLAFGLVVTAAMILAYECWLHAVKDAAIRRVLRDTTEREENTERLREDLMKAINMAKGVDNPRRFR
jgi:hypothetical protein